MLVLIVDLLSLSLTLISLFPHHILPFIFRPSVFSCLSFSGALVLVFVFTRALKHPPVN